MPELLYRAAPTDLEVRTTATGGRTIVGIAVPFDRPTAISEGSYRYEETFVRGAFARTISERGPKGVKAMVMHQRQTLPIGRAEVLREDPVGLYAELRVSKTEQGDEILELVKDGALDALSIGFQPDQDRWDARHSKVDRLSVKLREISVVDFPAYEGAVISAVRNDLPTIPHEVARRRVALLEKLAG